MPDSNDRYIDRLVANAPELSPAQRDKLSMIFANAPTAPRSAPGVVDIDHALIERLTEGLENV